MLKLWVDNIIAGETELAISRDSYLSDQEVGGEIKNEILSFSWGPKKLKN